MAGRLRSLVRAGLLALWLLVCLPAFLLSGARGRDRWLRRYMAGVLRLCGARLTIVGAPVRRDVLYAANHLSWLDILAIGSVTGAAFIAKSEIARWPLIGFLSRIGGTIFVARENRGAVRGQADTVAAALASGRPVALFAEGGTGDGTRLKPFRASLFAAVAQAPDVRVQPLAIDYGDRVAEVLWPAGESPAANALKLIAKRERLPVTLRFLPPIDPRALDRKEVARAAEAAVDAALAGSYSRAP